jgi:hypothetical protein
MQRHKVPAFPPSNPFRASASTAEAFTPRQLFGVKLGITEHQTPNEFTPSATLMGPFFFFLFPAPERIHGSENHCHFIALCFTSKCALIKDFF